MITERKNTLLMVEEINTDKILEAEIIEVVEETTEVVEEIIEVVAVETTEMVEETIAIITATSKKDTNLSLIII